jgi:hypothetical protein
VRSGGKLGGVKSKDPSLGRELYRLPFAVQQAKRFVIFIFGGPTVMVSVWAITMLNSAVFALADESHRLFHGILVFFTLLIVVGFNAAWWILRRYPHGLVVRERGLVLDHGSRTRSIGFDEVTGIEQRDDGGMPVYIVVLVDGSSIPFGAERASQEAARVIVRQGGLTWSEEPLRAERPRGGTAD